MKWVCQCVTKHVLRERERERKKNKLIERGIFVLFLMPDSLSIIFKNLQLTCVLFSNIIALVHRQNLKMLISIVEKRNEWEEIGGLRIIVQLRFIPKLFMELCVRNELCGLTSNSEQSGFWMQFSGIPARENY